MLDKYLPPTDSLYKFMAISGLMMIGLSLIPKYLSFQLEKDFVEYERQADAFQNELDRSMRLLLKKFQLNSEYQSQIISEIEKDGKLSDESVQQLRDIKTEMNNWEEFQEQLKIINSRADEVGLPSNEKEEDISLVYIDYFSQGNEKTVSDYLEKQKKQKIDEAQS